MLHHVLPSLGPLFDPLAPSTEEAVTVKRLRGILQRGTGFLVRISVPNSEIKAIVHLLPHVYSTGMKAALAYDCITCLLLPYRARPSPLNFVTSFASPQCNASVNAYFRCHLLPPLPVLKDCGDPRDMPARKGKMILAEARAYFWCNEEMDLCTLAVVVDAHGFGGAFIL
jgi:hypothetical protein